LIFLFDFNDYNWFQKIKNSDGDFETMGVFYSTYEKKWLAGTPG